MNEGIDVSVNQINYLEELSNYIFASKYARYNEEKKRRETWDECVDRVVNMHLEKYSFLDKESQEKIKWAFTKVKEKFVIPSMRSMQFGGSAIFAHNARMFNCSAMHVDSLRSFSEAFYLMMCGCGVTYGLSEKYMKRIPDLVSASDKTGTIINYVVEDSIEGWADSIQALLNCYFKNTPFSGRKIVFDFSRIRRKGTPLKTSGGKAPGHRGLKQSLGLIKKHLDHIIEYNNQKRLKTIDAYDILMHCSDAVLSGGIRRAASAVDFEINDVDMITAKTEFFVEKIYGFIKEEKEEKKPYNGAVVVNGIKYDVTLNAYDYRKLKKEKKIPWYAIYPWRARSNNSVRLIRGKFTKEKLKEIINSTIMWGDPGFVFANNEDSLFNPCREVGMVPVDNDGVCGVMFCNLSSINGKKLLSKEIFLEAVEAATIIGTLQAGYTNFPYLNNTSEQLTKQASLLGVSITGIMENPLISLNDKNQIEAAKFSIEINNKWAKLIGINPAARITCVKPEGTSSLILECSSGIHPHHARKYIRRVQANKIDPVYKFFKKINPDLCEESVWSSAKTDDVISFPVEVNETAIIKDDINAIKHLDIIKDMQKNWVLSGMRDNSKNITHNISCTVEVDTDEWDTVIDYLFRNQEYFSAVSLFGKFIEKNLPQMPLEKINTDNQTLWDNIVKNFKKVDYTNLIEDQDKTSLRQTIACSGNSCDISFEIES